MKVIVLLLFFSFSALAELNHETHDFSFEYGLAYHTLTGVQKSNQSKGQFTTDQNPFWLAAYTFRMTQNWGVRLFGGVHVSHFNEPKFGTVKNENQLLNQFGLEVVHKITPITKWGFFLMQQDHPLYYAKAPTVYEINKEEFFQGGLHWGIGQRRRIGLLWGLGLKGYLMFPAKGGSISTESGVGGEGYARLGWTDHYGNLYQIKGIYQGSTAPNAEVNFAHEILSYCLQISHTF